MKDAIELNLTQSAVDRCRTTLQGMLRNAIVELADRQEPERIAYIGSALAMLDRIKPTAAEVKKVAAPLPEEDKTPAFKIVGNMKIPTGNTVGEEKRAATDDAFAAVLNTRRNEKEAGEAAAKAGRR